MARRWTILWQGPLLLLLLLLIVTFGEIEAAEEPSTDSNIQNESLTTEASIFINEASGNDEKVLRNSDDGSLNSDNTENDVTNILLNSQDVSSNTDEAIQNSNDVSTNLEDNTANILDSSANLDNLDNPDENLESNVDSYSNNGIFISELSSTSTFSDRIGEVNDDNFERSTNAPRILQNDDGGWQPIVPSRQPTIRFPTFSSTISSPTVTPVPTLVVSSPVVSKVPISEYFSPDTFASGPLYSPEELEASISSSIEADASRLNIQPSRIPELQTSILTEPLNLAIVTPSLTAWDIPSVTIVEQPTSTIAPTPSLVAVETEVVDNALPETGSESTTGALPPRFNLDFDDSSPDYFLPTGDGLEYITGSEDPFEIPLSTIKPSLPSEDIGNTSIPTETVPSTAEDNSGTSFTAIASDKMEDVTAVTSGSVDNIVSTTVSTTVSPMPSTVKASTRTPLWMLLSKTTPETPSESLLILTGVTPPPTSSLNLVPTSTLVSSLSLLISEDNTLESSSLLVTELNNTSSLEIPLIASTIEPSADISTPAESFLVSNVALGNVFTSSFVEDISSSLTINPVSTVQLSELASSSIVSTLPITVPISETNLITSTTPITLSSSLGDSLVPAYTSTTPVSLSDNIDKGDEHNSSFEIEFSSNIAIASTALSGFRENNGEPIVVTVPEVIYPPTQVDSIVSSSIINSNDEVVSVTPVNAVINPELNSDTSVTWTPVGTGRDESLESTSSILSTLVTSSSVAVDINPEFTGGFTPIISETLEIGRGNERFTSEGPFSTQTQGLPQATATLTAPVSDFAPPRTIASTAPRAAPTTALPSVQSPDFSSESFVPLNHSRIESNIINPFTTKTVDVITTTPPLINNSVPKLSTLTTPVFIFTEELPMPTSSVPMDVSTSAVTIFSPEKTMVIVTEKLPPTPTVFIPVNEKNTSTSTAFSSPNMSSTTADPPIVNVTVKPFVSISLPTPVSPALLPPTVTEDTSTETALATSEFPVEITATHTEETNVIAVEENSTELSNTATNPTTQTSPKDLPISTTKTTATTPKTTNSPKTTATASSTTQRFTTLSSTETVINLVHPTESILYPTTTLVLSNGSSIERPVPYIRAVVNYSALQFCNHKINFRSMLSEWITQHLQEEIAVSPNEIVFFNMPDCIRMTLKEPNNNIETSELEESTDVFFYVTSQGKINPSLTEKFPLYTRELELPEDLSYLGEEVELLELIPVEDNYWSGGITGQEEAAIGTSIIVIIIIATLVGVTIILGLVFFMVVRRRSYNNDNYGRRCTPVSMDAYSMDSVSVYQSFRRKSKRNKSSRSVKSYLNQAFDDPNGPSRPLNFAKLTHFISDIDGVHEEFLTIPVNMPKYDEMPAGVEDKNRYANVIPVPETRVTLKAVKDSNINYEYINANYVRGPRNESKYYIATQAPLDETVSDFWRMAWEQETRVIVMITDFVEKGIDKCADYLPPSETLDCHRLYGDFQVTLKSRDMRENYVVSNVQLKNLENNLTREIAHMWYTGWPAAGVPNEEGAFISYILEIRRTRKKLRAKGPIIVHCSPGTGRTGTFLANDLCMRQFEEQRTVDIPRTVYSIRRDRAGAVQTKEQYAFIYRTINLYASKLTTGNLDSL